MDNTSRVKKNTARPKNNDEGLCLANQVKKGVNHMICPKCKEGNIKKIFFKKTEKIAYLCELCGAVWFQGKDVTIDSNKTIQSLTKDGDMEYTFVDFDGSDEEFKSVMYPKYK